MHCGNIYICRLMLSPLFSLSPHPPHMVPICSPNFHKFYISTKNVTFNHKIHHKNHKQTHTYKDTQQANKEKENTPT